MVNVRVARVPGQQRSFTLNDGSTVRDALNTAEIGMASGDEVTVNGVKRAQSHVLRDGDAVIVTAMVKGNMPDFITVTIAKVPGERKELTLNGGRKVSNALSEAGWRLGPREEIRVNNNRADKDTDLRHGDVVTITEIVKGN